MKQNEVDKLLWDVLSEEEKKLPVEDATRNFNMIINKEHIKRALNCRKDGMQCVVAQSVRDFPTITQVYIGATRSFLFFGTIVKRYTTPTVLRDALNKWDATGSWDLPVGVYQLKAISPSQRKEYFLETTKKYVARKRVGLSDKRHLTPNPRRLFAMGK